MRYLMDRCELRKVLDREGINPSAYCLDGGHGSEQYVIDIRVDGWVVYYSERGLESALCEFATEDEACRYLLEQLRRDSTTHFHLVVGPLGADDADAAFAAWLEAAGLTDIEATDVQVDNPVLAEGAARRYWVRGTRLPPT